MRNRRSQTPSSKSRRVAWTQSFAGKTALLGSTLTIFKGGNSYQRRELLTGNLGMKGIRFKLSFPTPLARTSIPSTPMSTSDPTANKLCSYCRHGNHLFFSRWFEKRSITTNDLKQLLDYIINEFAERIRIEYRQYIEANNQPPSLKAKGRWSNFQNIWSYFVMQESTL